MILIGFTGNLENLVATKFGPLPGFWQIRAWAGLFASFPIKIAWVEGKSPPSHASQERVKVLKRKPWQFYPVSILGDKYPGFFRPLLDD